MLERALAAVTISPGPLTIADFGSSQGRNSMRQMALAVDRLTMRGGQGRDVMVHTDLPRSPTSPPCSFLQRARRTAIGRAGTMCSAPPSARSFYERLLPAGSLDLRLVGLSPLHWMSAAAAGAARAHLADRPQRPRRPGRCAAVAAADWRRFLACRAEELVPGGQLVLVVGAVDETGASGLEPMMDPGKLACLAGLVAEGRLGAEDFAAMTHPGAAARAQTNSTAPVRTTARSSRWRSVGTGDRVYPSYMPPVPLAGRPDRPDPRLCSRPTSPASSSAAFAPSLFGDNQPLR